jgi:single-strand DNA-binding protein
MAGETVITVVGNLTSDPELRFTPSGAAVAGFTVASTPRTFDRESSQWKDGEPLFLRCSVWKQYAENVAESLTKGMGVIVQGRLKQRSYETREGEKRTVYELDVEEVGPSLKWATAKVTRSQRGSGGGGGGGYSGGGGGGGGDWGNSAPAPSSGGGSVQRSGGQQSGGQSAPQEDPWATGGGGSGGGWGGGYSDEPPF